MESYNVILQKTRYPSRVNPAGEVTDQAVTVVKAIMGSCSELFAKLNPLSENSLIKKAAPGKIIGCVLYFLFI